MRNSSLIDNIFFKNKWFLFFPSHHILQVNLKTDLGPFNSRRIQAEEVGRGLVPQLKEWEGPGGVP
ncbi:MAG: hypothetical protein L0Y56_22870, partial [Nitrospira sp.]|nr:hypothetical protein [Nitrospira sp.]